MGLQRESSSRWSKRYWGKDADNLNTTERNRVEMSKEAGGFTEKL